MITVPQIGVIASSAQSAFSPTSISGLKFWVKADSLALSDNDPVSSWTDSSGLNNHATNTGSLRPLYKTNIQNGKPVVRFDGTDDFLQVANTSIIGGESGLTLFFVAKQASALLTKALLTKWDYQTQGTFIASTYLGAINRFQFFIADALNDSGGNNQFTSNEVVSPTSFYIITMVYDGTQTAGNRIKFYINGGTAEASGVNGTVPATLTTSTSNLVVGSGQGALSTWNYNGDMGEIIMYNSALSDPNRTAVRDYLNARWATY